MENPVNLSSILVPIDFSPASRDALRWAARCVRGDDASLTIVHVLNVSLINTLIEHGFGTHDDVVAKLRRDAQQKLDDLKNEIAVPVNVLICEGVPFVEIIQKANDFAVDAVVMAKVGQRQQFETLLFGSTAEKVARGCRQPVIVLPSNEGHT